MLTTFAVTGLLIFSSSATADRFEDVFEQQIGYSYPQGRPQLAPGSLLHRRQHGLNIAPASHAEFRPLLQLDPLPLPQRFEEEYEVKFEAPPPSPAFEQRPLEHPQQQQPQPQPQPQPILSPPPPAQEYDIDYQQQYYSPAVAVLRTSYDHKVSSGAPDSVSQQYDEVPPPPPPPQQVVNYAPPQQSVRYVAPAATYDDANGYDYTVPSRQF